jgi:hypothetical protein
VLSPTATSRTVPSLASGLEGRVGIFTEREEILIRRDRPNAGCNGIRCLRGSRCKALAQAAPFCANALVHRANP